MPSCGRAAEASSLLPVARGWSWTGVKALLSLRLGEVSADTLPESGCARDACPIIVYWTIGAVATAARALWAIAHTLTGGAGRTRRTDGAARTAVLGVRLERGGVDACAGAIRGSARTRTLALRANGPLGAAVLAALYAARTGSGLGGPASSCCSTEEQASCCDPAEKAGCCGDTTDSSSCGCR
jgi:hypothetical protein